MNRANSEEYMCVKFVLLTHRANMREGESTPSTLASLTWIVRMERHCSPVGGPSNSVGAISVAPHRAVVVCSELGSVRSAVVVSVVGISRSVFVEEVSSLVCSVSISVVGEGVVRGVDVAVAVTVVSTIGTIASSKAISAIQIAGIFTISTSVEEESTVAPFNGGFDLSGGTGGGLDLGFDFSTEGGGKEKGCCKFHCVLILIY